MPTPKKGYFIGDKKLVSVTTVLGRFKESGALMHWAFTQGQSGASSLYEARDEAADIGTRAHKMIENHLNGHTVMLDMPDDNEELNQTALRAFDQYRQWEAQTKISILTKYQEIKLVCGCHMLGGTPDAIGMMDGELVLLDWKTSNGVYSDYILQLAAYRHLLREGYNMDTGDPSGFMVSDTVHLLRFSKGEPDFAHHKFTGVDREWEQFQLFRKAYDLDRIIKKRV